jgi:hypothetical protein
MNIKCFSDKVLLSSKVDVLRVHLYFKFVQHDIRPYENDISILLELYKQGGYRNGEEQRRFIDSCLEKKLKKSKQSVRNTVSKYISLGVLEKPKNSTLYISEKFLPRIECDRLMLQHFISHAE